MHGNAFEGVAKEVYAKETGLYIQDCGLIVCESEPWMAYSPDGIVVKESTVFRLLEIKCPYQIENTENVTLLKKCKFLHLEKNEIKIKKKHQYYAQIQFGMAVLNLKQCDFVIYSNISHSIKILTVDFDDIYVNNLLHTLKNIYFKNMLHEICINSRVL